MKRMLLVTAVALLMSCDNDLNNTSTPRTYIYDRTGVNVIYRVENNLVFEGRFGTRAIYNIRNNLIFEGQFGTRAVYSIRGNSIFEGRYGTREVYRIRNDRIYSDFLHVYTIRRR